MIDDEAEARETGAKGQEAGQYPVGRPCGAESVTAAAGQTKAEDRPVWIDLDDRYLPISPASIMNRRMRNRTYGGVGGGRMIPAPYPMGPLTGESRQNPYGAARGGRLDRLRGGRRAVPLPRRPREGR